MSTPVSPEVETQVASIMRKRFHSSSPTDETGQGSAKKNKKEEVIHSPTTSSMTPKLDDNVFASAYALASLALSPGQAYAAGAPYSPNPYEQTREDDVGRIDELHYSLREPSSPGIDGIPLSPSGSTADIRRRRVKFATRMEHMRSMPGRVPYGRMGVPNRMLFRHGPAFHPPPRQPYPYGATPWSIPMGHLLRCMVLAHLPYQRKNANGSVTTVMWLPLLPSMKHVLMKVPVVFVATNRRNARCTMDMVIIP